MCCEVYDPETRILRKAKNKSLTETPCHEEYHGTGRANKIRMMQDRNKNY